MSNDNPAGIPPNDKPLPKPKSKEEAIQQEILKNPERAAEILRRLLEGDL